jgi:hypothetical protein
VVSHGRYIVFQIAEVVIPRQMFQEILRLIADCCFRRHRHAMPKVRPYLGTSRRSKKSLQFVPPPSSSGESRIGIAKEVSEQLAPSLDSGQFRSELQIHD